MLHTIPAHPSEHHPHPPQHTIPHHRSAAEAVAAAQNDGKLHVLLAASGSVATIKLPLIAERLVRLCPGGDGSLSIRIVLTEAATRFLAGQSPEQPTLSALDRIDGVDGIYLDKDEWGPEPWKREDPILHIELRKCKSSLAVCPSDAGQHSVVRS